MSDPACQVLANGRSHDVSASCRALAEHIDAFAPLSSTVHADDSRLPTMIPFRELLLASYRSIAPFRYVLPMFHP